MVRVELDVFFSKFWCNIDIMIIAKYQNCLEYILKWRSTFSREKHSVFKIVNLQNSATYIQYFNEIKGNNSFQRGVDIHFGWHLMKTSKPGSVYMSGMRILAKILDLMYKLLQSSGKVKEP